jgi:hypothetical protein
MTFVPGPSTGGRARAGPARPPGRAWAPPLVRWAGLARSCQAGPAARPNTQKNMGVKIDIICHGRKNRDLK